MKWWLWRLKPDPKKFLGDVEMNIGYVDPGVQGGHRISGYDMGHATRERVYSHMTGTDAKSVLDEIEQVFNALTRRGRSRINVRVNRDGEGRLDGHVRESPIGKMRAFKFETMIPTAGGRLSRYAYWLTPPMEQFADLSKHFSAEVLREHGLTAPNRERTYWVNQEVLAATGEYVGGSLAGIHQPSRLEDLRAVARPDNEIGQFLLVALDSFLERGAPDPRFNPGRRRKNAPTTVDDVIQFAMDAVEEKKEGWFAKANEILRQVNADYIGRKTKASPIVVAQCIRDIEGPEQTVQALYRIWGKSKLRPKKPLAGQPLYVIASTSKRMRTWGETAIFQARADATEVEDAAWPMGIVGEDMGFGGGANFSVDSHNEAFQGVGITHVVPCDAQVFENPPAGSAEPLAGRAQVDRLRSELAARTERCTDFAPQQRPCPGWDVFDTDRGLEIEVCDECNSLARARGEREVTDAEVAQLPEAQRALRETQARWDIEAGAQ